MTRTIPLTILLSITFSAAAMAQVAEGWVYQSSYNNEMYVVRQKGPNGLDLFTEDGRLMASMSRNRPNDKLKGVTYQLASKCPEGKGKIEVLDLTPDRIRVRVERPTVAPNVRPACMQLILSSWDTFDLVKHHESAARDTGGGQTRGQQSGGGGVGGDRQGRGGQDPAPSFIQEVEGFTIELERCEKKGGASVTCYFSAVNHKADRPLAVHGTASSGYGYGGWAGSSIVDSSGIQQNANGATLGSSQGGSASTDTVADVKVTGTVTFGGLDPGVDRIARLILTFWTNNRGNGKDFQLTFRNIQLANPDAAIARPAPPVVDAAPASRAGLAASVGLLNTRGTSGCLAIENKSLQPGTPITILQGNHDSKVPAVGLRVGRRLTEPCSEARGEGESTYYQVPIPNKVGAESANGIAYVGGNARRTPEGWVVDGTPVQIRSCGVGQSIMETLWSGRPLASTRLWLFYYSIGYEVERTCTERDGPM
jgi:hypothetical protein